MSSRDTVVNWGLSALYKDNDLVDPHQPSGYILLWEGKKL